MLQTAKVIAAGAHSLQFMATSPGQITDLARAIKYFRSGIVSDSSGENPLFTDGSFIFPPGDPYAGNKGPFGKLREGDSFKGQLDFVCIVQ